METGIYNEHKTVIVFGGAIGMAAAGDEEGNFYILLGELSKKYKSGDKLSDEDANNLVKNAEICMFFPEINDMIAFRGFVEDAYEEMVKYKTKRKEEINERE